MYLNKLAVMLQHLGHLRAQKEDEFADLAKQTNVIFKMIRRRLDIYQRKAEEEIKQFMQRDLNEIALFMSEVEHALLTPTESARELLVDLDVKQCFCRNRAQLFKWNYDAVAYAQTVLLSLVDDLQDHVTMKQESQVTVVNTFNPSSLFQLSEEEAIYNLASTLRPITNLSTHSPSKMSTARLRTYNHCSSKENACPNSECDSQSLVEQGSNQIQQSFELCRSTTMESLYNIENLKIKMPNFSLESYDSPQLQEY